MSNKKLTNRCSLPLCLAQQLVKVNLNSIVFCGEFASFYIGGGLLGALLSSLFTKRIKNVVLVMKVLVCGHSVASVLLFLVLKYQLPSVGPFYWEIIVLINSGCTGFFVYTIIPLGLDLGSSCSFPNCTESSSNGLLIISGQALGLVLTLLMRALAQRVCVEEEGKKVGMLGLHDFDYQSNHSSIDSNSQLDDCPANRVDYDYTSESLSLSLSNDLI